MTAADGAAAARDRRALRLLLAGLTAWAGWFIARSTLIAGGKRFFCLFDDAMISMTYARNLVEGHGLNWARAGAPVEGFTHPLWMALMVPINALALDLRYRGLLVELMSLGFLLLHVVLVRRLTLRYFSTERARHWLPAALLTAFYYPLDFWALVGMESALQALVTTASVLLALDIVCGGLDRHRELLLIGAAAYLLRMDMLLIVAVAQLYVFAGGGLRQPRQRAHWWQGVAALVAVVAGYGAFRWWYFGDLLPNTWYLKLYRIPLGLRLLRGSWTLWQSLSDQLLPLAVAGAGAGVLIWRRAGDGGERELRRRVALPAALLVTACAYSVYVGGDGWEMEHNVRANRFLVYVMPQAFILLNGIINEAAGYLQREAARRRFVVAAAAVAILCADGLWLAAAPADNWKDLLVARRPRLIAEEAPVLRELLALQATLGGAAAPGTFDGSGTPASSSVVVATSVAGIPAYFSDYRMVDVLGYNERHIARLAPRLPLGEEGYQYFQPGHLKWDYAYLLARYHPDVIITPLPIGPEGPPWRLLGAAGYHVEPGGFYRLASGSRGHR